MKPETLEEFKTRMEKRMEQIDMKDASDCEKRAFLYGALQSCYKALYWEYENLLEKENQRK